MKERNNQFPDKKNAEMDYKRVTNFLKEGSAIFKEFDIGQTEATFKPRPEYPNLPIAILVL